MKKLYKVNGVEVSEKPSNGEMYERIVMIGDHILEHNVYQASTQSERDALKLESEREWVKSELDLIDSKNYGNTFPYLVAIQEYMQELRDHSKHPDFPNNSRPKEPLTSAGDTVINRS